MEESGLIEYEQDEQQEWYYASITDDVQGLYLPEGYVHRDVIQNELTSIDREFGTSHLVQMIISRIKRLL